jgi:NAD(P)-dependent dehydrogenase (short-subunit alcohol dehydrogenase family)
MKLVDRVGIVTGAASGIGRASAIALAREGASLVLADMTVGAGQEAADEICRSGGQAIFVETDVASAAQCKRMVSAAMERFGKLDLVVNNAAILGPMAPLIDFPLDAWSKTIAVNLSGVFYCLQAEIPILAKAGGTIVNIASIAGLTGFPQQSAYIAAKHGVVGLTKAVCVEYGPQGIRCNCIAPGSTATPMITNAASPEFFDALPARRIGQPQEIADAVVWLSSDASSYVNGICLPVDGGYMAT